MRSIAGEALSRGTEAFEQAHEHWLSQHASLRSGERKGRLLRGHQHAEKLFLQQVWWPLFQNLEQLHPEYEVTDWNRKSHFIDFAFIAAFGRFGLECDGYQSHIVDMDRERFSHALNRDNYLTAMGWKMLHFSYDDVQKRPDICRMLLKLALSPYLLRTHQAKLSLEAKEVLRYALSMSRPIRGKEVAEAFQVNYRTARNWLHELTEGGMLRPLVRGKHVHFYELTSGAAEHLLQ